MNPKECEALALVFEEDSATDELRGHVLDLLAAAGTFEAQVVIRRLLALAVARRDSRTFSGFVQRLGCLECPDGPTLRFLMSVYAESRNEAHDVRSACAYALGAAAGRAFSSGDPEAAVRASDVLRRDLLAASTAPEKSALVTALGNAGVPGDVPVIVRFTQDAEAPVRAASALALRRMNIPDARKCLIGMLADREYKVTQSALVALGELKLEDEELEKIAELVLGGHLSPAIDGRVLRLVVAQRPRLTSCPGRAGAIENALRLLLGRAEAQVGETTGVTGASGSGERRVAVQPPVAPAPPAAAPSPFPIGVAPIRPSQIEILNAPAPPQESGAYQIVRPGDSVDVVRERMIRLGLDPNARGSIIPQPPPRRAATGAAPAYPSRAPATRIGR